MKNNLISAIAGWKSAALLALIAMVAAVAFSGVLTTGQTAEAQTPNPSVGATGETSEDVVPGATVDVETAAEIVRLSINSISTASASFVVGGGTSIACSDSEVAGGCDADVTADNITVHLKVDDDSPNGFVLIDRRVVLTTGGAAGEEDQLVVTVTKQPKADSLKISATPLTIAAAAGTSAITAQVLDEEGKGLATAGQITFIASLGSLSDCTTGAGQFCSDDTLDTDSNAGDDIDDVGQAAVTLTGANLEGIATVTARYPGLDDVTVDITLFGTAKALSASAAQGSVHVGGSVLVTLSVTDGADNPVADVTTIGLPTPATDIEGPSDDAEKVVVTGGYVADNPATLASEEIPSCVAFDDLDAEGNTVSRTADTNDKGQCALTVTARVADAATSVKAATLGTNTITFQIGTGAAAIKADPIEVTVAGIAASIETDPADGSRLEPLSDNTITITVRDEEGVLVGASNVDVVQVAGDGLTEGLGVNADMPAQTKDGSATFSYTAGLGGDQVVFRIRAGSGTDRITSVLTLHVGPEPEPEPEPTPEPEPEPLTWSRDLITGWNVVSWSGEDTSPADAAAGSDITAIWHWDGATFTWHFTGDTAGIPNTLGELDTGEGYFVFVDDGSAEEAAAEEAADEEAADEEAADEEAADDDAADDTNGDDANGGNGNGNGS